MFLFCLVFAPFYFVIKISVPGGDSGRLGYFYPGLEILPATVNIFI